MAINKILLHDIIQEGTRQWEQTFDAIEDPLTIIDRNYNIIKANQAAAKVFVFLLMLAESFYNPS